MARCSAAVVGSAAAKTGAAATGAWPRRCLLRFLFGARADEEGAAGSGWSTAREVTKADGAGGEACGREDASPVEVGSFRFMKRSETQRIRSYPSGVTRLDSGMLTDWEHRPSVSSRVNVTTGGTGGEGVGGGCCAAGEGGVSAAPRRLWVAEETAGAPVREGADVRREEDRAPSARSG